MADPNHLQVTTEPQYVWQTWRVGGRSQESSDERAREDSVLRLSAVPFASREEILHVQVQLEVRGDGEYGTVCNSARAR